MPPQARVQPSLPVAADHAVLSNRIALLLSKQSTLRQTMTPNQPSRDLPRQTASAAAVAAKDREEDEDLVRAGANPNAGAGYVSETMATAAGKRSSREEYLLRRRLLGTRSTGTGGPANGRGGAESESDEEQGRSALGKKKRKRPGAEDGDADAAAVDELAAAAREDEARPEERLCNPAESTESPGPTNKKKKQKKRKTTARATEGG
ncbi:hypothetical protein RJ55_07145 [Drechmeria coniospora]|nr:hypothetical protein RJ55_07145 [Drechmeria coniospora]